MRKILISLFLLFCIIHFLSAQEAEGKSIKFSDLTSSSVILYSSLEKLIYFLGTPDVVFVNNRFYCKENGKGKDTISFFNSLRYKNRHLVYWEHNDSVRIHNIYFDKKTDYRIFHHLECFSKDLKITCFTKRYNIPEERIWKIIGKSVPFKSKSNSIYYQIDFRNNENYCEEVITFYFNSQGYLQAITFSIY